jgi:hypothetical protein
MLRLLRKLALPNVVEFSLTDPQINNIALLSGFTVRDRTFKTEASTRRNAKANNYLAKQFSRLEKHAKSGNFEAFNKIGLQLLQNSVAFLVYSFNSVMPKWTSMDFRKARKLLGRTQKLCKKLETDIDYKRVWIDKKPGDYGRPLGVPKAAWRIYLRMTTNLGEIYAHGRDLYDPNQHGGRPGYGVMSCLRQLAETLPKYKRVYEFDLKGFFDHISHKSMLDIFEGTFLKDLYSKMLKSSPKSYILPPIQSDLASTRYLKIPSEDKISLFNIIPELENHIAFYENAMENPNSIIITKEESELGITLSVAKDLLLIELQNAINMYLNEIGKLLPPIYIPGEDTSLRSVYSVLMKMNEQAGSIISGPFPVMEHAPKPITEEDRAIGRDDWKELNLPDQGVPQGTSFGPFLSSLAVSVYFREANLKHWIMYIDDGLIFHNSPVQLRERLARLQKALNKMSVELAPEKSKLHTTTTLLTESIKFLGIRLTNQGPSVFKRSFFTVASDTRKGTRKSIPSLTSAQMLSVLEEMLKDGLITISKYRYAKWAVAQSKMKELFEGDVVALSIKYGFFGYLLSWLYNPETDMESMKAKINQGVKLATETILKQERSIGSMILKEAQWEYLDVNGVVRSIKPDLNNHSTLSVELLLESLQQGIVSLRSRKRLVSKGTKRVSLVKPVSGWWSTQQIDNHNEITHLILRNYQLDLRLEFLRRNLVK